MLRYLADPVDVPAIAAGSSQKSTGALFIATSDCILT